MVGVKVTGHAIRKIRESIKYVKGLEERIRVSGLFLGLVVMV